MLARILPLLARVLFAVQDAYAFIYTKITMIGVRLLVLILSLTKRQNKIIWAGTATGLNLTSIIRTYYKMDRLLSTGSMQRWLRLNAVQHHRVDMIICRDDMFYACALDLDADRELLTNSDIDDSLQLEELQAVPLPVPYDNANNATFSI